MRFRLIMPFLAVTCGFVLPGVRTVDAASGLRSEFGEVHLPKLAIDKTYSVWRLAETVLEEPVPGERVIDQRVAKELLSMMEGVVSLDGASGRRAALIGYRVAGKTGTAWTADGGSYSTQRYKASFGGVVPASRPRLAAIVVIDEPGGEHYYGGEVAAPVFSAVMAGALRLLAIAPDDLQRMPATTLVQAQDPW